MTESRTATAADWATELPHEPPRNEPTWCENYCFDLHDGMLGISLWLHLSRSQLHPTLWREVINVILPDGRIGMWKGYGRGPVVRPRPEGPTLSVDVIEPFERLQLSCIGVVQLTDEEELITGPLGDDIEVPFLLDLEWRSATEVWDLRDHMADQVWATGHYEQGGRVTGTLAVDGQEWAFNAPVGATTPSAHGTTPVCKTMIGLTQCSRAATPSRCSGTAKSVSGKTSVARSSARQVRVVRCGSCRSIRRRSGLQGRGRRWSRSCSIPARSRRPSPPNSSGRPGRAVLHRRTRASGGVRRPVTCAGRVKPSSRGGGEEALGIFERTLRLRDADPS